jgi:hypothetical protein
MPNSSCWWVDIILTKDGICTLVDVVIVDPMWVDLLFQFCTNQKFNTVDVIQAKETDYHDRHPIDQFNILAIDVFGCLHKQINVFLHNCADVIWSFKRLEGPSLFVLITFLHKKNSITLQRIQTSSIFNQVVGFNTYPHHHD